MASDRQVYGKQSHAVPFLKQSEIYLGRVRKRRTTSDSPQMNEGWLLWHVSLLWHKKLKEKKRCLTILHCHHRLHLFWLRLYVNIHLGYKHTFNEQISNIFSVYNINLTKVILAVAANQSVCPGLRGSIHHTTPACHSLFHLLHFFLILFSSKETLLKTVGLQQCLLMWSGHLPICGFTYS